MAAGTGGFSTPPPDYVSDDESVYDAYDAFDFPGKEHNLTAVADRRVKVLIKDAHDHMGPGMTFEVKYLSTLKSAFGCFKAASCKTCRSSDEMRFKTKEKRIEESDTPMSVSNDVDITVRCTRRSILICDSFASRTTPRSRSSPGRTFRAYSARRASPPATQRRTVWAKPSRRCTRPKPRQLAEGKPSRLQSRIRPASICPSRC